MQEYDYIIVGGGSAGCVLAIASVGRSRTTRVLLIESGQRDSDKYIHIPATFFKVLEKGRDALLYASEPEKGLNGRPSIVPQGHVLGGGSSVNAMVYIRGSRRTTTPGRRWAAATGATRRCCRCSATSRTTSASPANIMASTAS